LQVDVVHKRVPPDCRYRRRSPLIAPTITPQASPRASERRSGRITHYSDGQFGCHAALGEPKKLVKLLGAWHYQSCYFCNPEMHEIGMAEAAARFKQYL
jgi:hypothetical protein